MMELACRTRVVEISNNDIISRVMKLDDYIDQESLEIMKLSMRVELSQAELESVRYLSDLFRTLEKHYDNSEVLLGRFMYTLKILGHGRYGERAIRELESLQQKLNPFSLDKDLKRGVDFDNFCLHQHLALACSMVPKEGNERVIRQFARMINVNPSTVSTPCEIVTKLIESRKITVKNQLDLVEEVFIKSKLFSEDQLRKYIENCERINCCQWIASRSSSVTTLDSTGTVTASKRYVKASNCSKNNCIECCHGSLWWLFYVTAIGYFLLLVPVFGGIFMLGSTGDSSGLTLHQSNSTVIIANSSSVTVIQDARHPKDFEHQIDVYQVDHDCSKLPAGRRHYTTTGYNDFSSINGTTVYALAGSFITLEVCGSTNSMYIPGRLEVALVESLEALHSSDKLLENIFDLNFFFPGVQGEWKCKEVTFSIDHFGYYTLFILPQPKECLFNFTATYNYRFVDLTLLSVKRKHTYTLFEDQDQLELPGRRWFNKNLCVLAHIKHNPNSPSNNVHIRHIYVSDYHFYVGGQYTVIIGLVVDFFCLILFLLVMWRKNIIKLFSSKNS